MGSLRITYTPRPDVTSEAELSALCNVYRYVLEASRKNKSTRPGAPDDAKKEYERR